jgi:hypothetical protein
MFRDILPPGGRADGAEVLTASHWRARHLAWPVARLYEYLET